MLAQTTVADLKEQACRAFKLEEVDVQMWDHFSSGFSSDRPLDDKPDATLAEEKVLNLQQIMLLEKASPHQTLYACCFNTGVHTNLKATHA